MTLRRPLPPETTPIEYGEKYLYYREPQEIQHFPPKIERPPLQMRPVLVRAWLVKPKNRQRWDLSS